MVIVKRTSVTPKRSVDEAYGPFVSAAAADAWATAKWGVQEPKEWYILILLPTSARFDMKTVVVYK